MLYALPLACMFVCVRVHVHRQEHRHTKVAGNIPCFIDPYNTMLSPIRRQWTLGL